MASQESKLRVSEIEKYSCTSFWHVSHALKFDYLNGNSMYMVVTNCFFFFFFSSNLVKWLQVIFFFNKKKKTLNCYVKN